MEQPSTVESAIHLMCTGEAKEITVAYRSLMLLFTRVKPGEQLSASVPAIEELMAGLRSENIAVRRHVAGTIPLLKIDRVLEHLQRAVEAEPDDQIRSMLRTGIFICSHGRQAQ